MTKYFLTLTVILALGMARADEPKKPDAPEPEPTKDAGVLTPEKLRQMLRDLAYDPKDISLNNKKNVYEIVTERNNWKIYMTVSVSNDLSELWMDARFAALEGLEEAPSAAWLKLLELSNDNDPIHFTLDAKKRIHIAMPRSNYGLTPVELRKEIEKFDAAVRQTEPFWKNSNFKPVQK